MVEGELGRRRKGEEAERDNMPRSSTCVGLNNFIYRTFNPGLQASSIARILSHCNGGTANTSILCESISSDQILPPEHISIPLSNTSLNKQESRPAHLSSSRARHFPAAIRSRRFIKSTTSSQTIGAAAAKPRSASKERSSRVRT